MLSELATAASATYAGIHKKILYSGATIFIISNKVKEVIIKVSKSIEEPVYW